MALPVLQHSPFIITIPSTKEQKKFRLYTVGEEKILLTAAENATGNLADALAALAHVIKNCAIDPIDVDKLTTFDVEWIMIKLREHSVSDVLSLEYTDPTTKDKQPIVAPLSTAQVSVNELSKEVVLDAEHKISMTLGFPTYKALQWMSVSEDNKDPSTADEDFLIICAVIKQVTSGSEVFDLSQNSPPEIREFVESLTIPQMNEIIEWVKQIPYVYIDIKLPNGQTERLRDIRRFFA